MTMRIQTARAGVLALGLAFFAVPAGAAVFGDWDANSDARLTSEEFRTGFEKAGVFGEWDADDNRTLTRSEFGTGVGKNAKVFDTRFGRDAFGTWDANGDKILSETEFYNGVYASYDRNKSRVIEEPEFGDLGDDMGDGGLWDV